MALSFGCVKRLAGRVAHGTAQQPHHPTHKTQRHDTQTYAHTRTRMHTNFCASNPGLQQERSNPFEAYTRQQGKKEKGGSPRGLAPRQIVSPKPAETGGRYAPYLRIMLNAQHSSACLPAGANNLPRAVSSHIRARIRGFARATAGTNQALPFQRVTNRL